MPLDDTVGAQFFTPGLHCFVNHVDVDLDPEGVGHLADAAGQRFPVGRGEGAVCEGADAPPLLDGFHNGDWEFFSYGFSSSSEGNQHFAAGGALLHQL